MISLSEKVAVGPPTAIVRSDFFLSKHHLRCSAADMFTLLCSLREYFAEKGSRKIYLVFNCLEDCKVSDLIDDFKIRWIIQNYSVQYQGGILEKIGQEILD